VIEVAKFNATLLGTAYLAFVAIGQAVTIWPAI
jgi:hypothetical protein